MIPGRGKPGLVKMDTMDKQQKTFNTLALSENYNLIRDCLKIMITERRHLEKVHAKLNEVGIIHADNSEEVKLLNELKDIPRVFIEDGGSLIYYKTLSDACRHCRLDAGCTIRITSQCNRRCFFCFVKPAGAEETSTDINDYMNTIRDKAGRVDLKSVAVSGGEPFLYPERVFQLFDAVNSEFKNTLYKRIYTNGDYLDADILKKLKERGLDEIRLSIKPTESPDIGLFETVKAYIPRVVVEFPVLPGSFEPVKTVMEQLEHMGIDGVNLIELFFNGYNSDGYRKEGFRINLSDYGIRDGCDFKPIYEYPVWGSRRTALQLIRHFARAKMNMFIHLCSQKTKDMQYQQMRKRALLKNKIDSLHLMNGRYLVVLAVYEDVDETVQYLGNEGVTEYFIREDDSGFQRVELHPGHYTKLRKNNWTTALIFRSPGNSFDAGFKLLNVPGKKHHDSDSRRLMEKLKELAQL